MAATREQIYAALQAADKAGNVEDAKALAAQYAATPAAAPAPEKPKEATFGSTVGRALWNLPYDAIDTGAQVLKSTVEAAAHPVQTWHAATVTLPDKIASVLSGGIQHVREMSSPEFQGDAPKMDTKAYDEFAGDNYNKYGTKQALYKTVGDHPAGVALAAAALLDPALRVAGVRGGVIGAADRGVTAAKTATGDAFGKVAAPVAQTYGKITEAERRANAAAAAMSGEATDTFKAGQAAATTDATTAQTNAERAAALAEQSRARAKALDERRAALVPQTKAPELAIGDPRHLSEMGDAIREPAVQSQDAINAGMREADTKYRSAMDQIAADRAAAGIGVSDTPTAKLVIKQSKSVVDPDPVKRPSVGSIPADSAGGKLHSMLLDVLQPKEVPLSVNEAKRARAAGIEVNVAKDGSFTRTIKPDLKAVDDFRRFLGKVLDGKIEGYEAVNRVEASQMYQNVSKVIDKYVAGASKPVQQSWAEGKRALEPFEKVRAGQAVVGTQPGTDVAAVPAANIPGRVLSGGRDTVRQVAAVAGEAPVAATLRSQVQNAFAAAPNADAAEALVRPGTKLGDAISGDPDLTEAVQSYIARVRSSETAAQQAERLAQRSSTAASRAAKLDKASGAYQKTAATATDSARELERHIASLAIADPQEVGSQYVAMLNRAHKAGTIDTAKYEMGLRLAQRAEKDFALKASRNKWLRWAGYAAGLGIAPALGADVLHAVRH